MYACVLYEPINHFNWPAIDHQSTSNDRLKPVLTLARSIWVLATFWPTLFFTKIQSLTDVDMGGMVPVCDVTQHILDPSLFFNSK